MSEQVIKEYLVKVGDIVRVKLHDYLGECRALEKTVQGVLVESIEQGEKLWVPDAGNWLEKIEREVTSTVPPEPLTVAQVAQMAPMTLDELKRRADEANAEYKAYVEHPALPVTDTVPEPIPAAAVPEPQPVPVPVQEGVPEAKGSIDPSTGLWVPPVTAPDAGVL